MGYAYNANNVPPNLLEETVAGLSPCSTIILLFYEDCKNMESNLIYFMSLILDLVLCLTSGVWSYRPALLCLVVRLPEKEILKLGEVPCWLS